MAEFYSASGGTIPRLPWLTFPPPFSGQYIRSLIIHAVHAAYPLRLRLVAAAGELVPSRGIRLPIAW